jgi:hypothetical protein
VVGDVSPATGSATLDRGQQVDCAFLPVDFSLEPPLNFTQYNSGFSRYKIFRFRFSKMIRENDGVSRNEIRLFFAWFEGPCKSFVMSHRFFASAGLGARRMVELNLQNIKTRLESSDAQILSLIFHKNKELDLKIEAYLSVQC